MRFCVGSPGGWTRPLSRIAIRSCTHSSGLSVASCASRNPAQPPSRGCAANSSERVGLDGAGTRHGSLAPLGSARGLTGLERAQTAPPATRDKPLATRLTTFMFYFCSYLASLDRESIPRLGSLDFLEEPRDLANGGA